MKPERAFLAAIGALVVIVLCAGAARHFAPPEPIIKAEPVTEKDRAMVACRARGGEPVMGYGYSVVCVKALGK